ncbi:hypothetical protein MHBO_001373 [Bonamia ostreae]|uniref:ABC transporter domain-containing protein n=1 Tax=Bonamia ostreae TaxID=126728 RepID=A0ABV2AIS7_9EUKA
MAMSATRFVVSVPRKLFGHARAKCLLRFFRPVATLAPEGMAKRSAMQFKESDFVLKAESISKKFEDEETFYILKDVSFRCVRGSKVAITGVNGSGKSTLMRILAKKDKNFEGTLKFGDPSTTVAHHSQEIVFDEKETILDYLKTTSDICFSDR